MLYEKLELRILSLKRGHNSVEILEKVIGIK
jgi:hypothetical protein